MKKTAIVLVGPTAVGKSAAAIEIAAQFGTEIISADSRQCFRELNIGVAVPSERELTQVKHHFIHSHSIFDDMSAGIFESYALGAATQIFEDHQTLVVVGGTGLYVRAFMEGIDPVPVVDESVRNEISLQFEQFGLDWLREQVKIHDPVFFASADNENPHRLLRALEVVKITGKSIREFQQHKIQPRPFDIIRIGLDMPREALYDRINNRVDLMMNAGLLDEVRASFPFRNLNALQTVGYQELFRFLDGEISLSHAIALIKQHTRNYAKRQLTWFRRMAGITWFHPDRYEDLPACISKNINQV